MQKELEEYKEGIDMDNTWEHFDNLVREATGSMQHAFEEGICSETEFKLYIEDTKAMQKKVKGDDYNEINDSKILGY